MSRGGRGYSSRGSSYRGSGRGSSSWSDRGGRGSFSSSRGGRFSSSWSGSNANSFESRSRYTSGASGERYSRGRPEEPSYRRSSYRSEAPNSYSSSRDASLRSPDRKRMRTSEAPSSRRSHEGGYGGDGYSGGGNSRYESSQGGGGYSERRSFTEDRRPTFRPPRDDYRKAVSATASAPTSSARISPRGGGGGVYRGRASTRGIRGGGGGGSSGRVTMRDGVVRRRLVHSGYVRKRGAPLRSTADYLRRLRISRLRSAVPRRTVKKSRSSDKEDSDKEEENWDEDEKEGEKKTAEAEKTGEEKKVLPVKTPKKDKEKEKEKEKDKDESDKDEKKSVSEEEDDRPRSKYTGKLFIKLTCVHCGMKCVTFREYSAHLFGGRHIQAMRDVAIKQKTVLARMRQAQRNAQRELEKTDDALAPRTNFCPLCKLNYRQMKAKHQLSEAHRNMKKFLMPYCRTCHITFKSPMLYENHMCSLEHIKRKAMTSDGVNGDKNTSDKDPGSPVEEDIDENFMTLDSVGDVDEENEDEDGNKTPKSPTGEGGDAAKPKEPVNVGVEHVKKVEVYYCDLCNTYLSRHEDTEKALKQHCRGRLHLQRYVRYKEDKNLRRQAERIHRKSQEAKEAKEKEKEKTTAKPEEKTEKEPVKEKEEELKPDKEKETEEKAEQEDKDDKMWADVDKDLGEILAEVNHETADKSSDEDEDSRPDGERYDRFRLSEKGGEEKQEEKTVTDEKETDEKENNDEDKEEDKEKSADDK